MPMPGDGPIKLSRKGSLPPPSSAPRAKRAQVSLPSTIRSRRDSRSRSKPIGSSKDDTAHRYLQLLPRREDVVRPCLPDPVEPEPAPPPTPQEIISLSPVVRPRPRLVEPPTTSPRELEPADECSEELRRRGVSWIIAATLGLGLAAAALVLLVALVVGSALPTESTPALSPKTTAVEHPAATPAVTPKVVITAVAPERAAPVVFEPERITRSTVRSSRRASRRRPRRGAEVNPDALLAASRRAAAVNPDILLAAGARQARRSPRRDRHGVVLPSWTR